MDGLLSCFFSRIIVLTLIPLIAVAYLCCWIACLLSLHSTLSLVLQVFFSILIHGHSRIAIALFFRNTLLFVSRLITRFAYHLNRFDEVLILFMATSTNLDSNKQNQTIMLRLRFLLCGSGGP